MTSAFIECECHSDEHVLRYTIDAEDRVIYTSVFLKHWQSWYVRVWIAIKYVFGYKCKYGHFDCTLMGPDQVRQLRKVIYDYEDICLHEKGALEPRIIHYYDEYEDA